MQSKSILNYHALLVKLQRRFANGFSLLGAYTFAKALDYTSDNDGTVTVLNVYNIAGYNYGPADYDIKHTLSLSGMWETPWARQKWYGGWQLSGILYWRTGFAFPVTQTQGVQSTGTGNRPDTIGDGTLERPHHRQVVQHRRLQPPHGHHGDLWQHRAQHAARARGLQHRHVGHQVHADRPTTLELRCEAFNVLNHPQFNFRPNSTIGNAAAGTITSMLTNPACSICGTTERNIQFAAKLTF